MKKLFVLSLMLGTLVFVVPSADAKATAAAVSADPQINIRLGQPRRRPFRRVVMRTRITRIGPWRYRETVRYTYLPNGRVRTQVISRVRLGRWYNGRY